MKKTKIVCFGGGTGLSELLKGLKHNPWLDISAIVTMFDSGGSSRVLKDKLGILPPGDIFRCVLALTPQEHERTLRAVFEQRLKDNHSPGNICLVGAESTYDDYQTAIDQMCRMFLVDDRVFPVSVERSNLCAEFTDGSSVQSETEIDRGIRDGKDVSRLFLKPDVPAHQPALESIRQADLICIGPGSFYTSILPNFLPSGVRYEVSKSTAPVIFIANLLTEGMGMQGYDARRYLRTLEHYIRRDVSAMVLNDTIPANLKPEYANEEHKIPILPPSDWQQAWGIESMFFPASLWIDGQYARHDSVRLANFLWPIAHGKLQLYQRA